MRTTFLFPLIILFYFFIVPVSAQTVQPGGTAGKEIPVKEGKIIGYFRDDIRSGETETELWPITPSNISPAVNFIKKFGHQSKKFRQFFVYVNPGIPEASSISGSDSTGWTACDLGVTTCILPGGTCSALQKGMATSLAKEPLLPASSPEINPVYSTKMITSITKDQVITTLTATNTEIVALNDRVYFTYEKIAADYPAKKERKENKEWLLNYDSLPADGSNATAALARFGPGLYVFHAIANYGSNQSYVHSNYIVLPQKRNPPTISNAEIEKLRKEEQRLRDSIDMINRIIEYRTNQINQNYQRRRSLDSMRWVRSTIYNQLHLIDALIEQIPGSYGVPLQNLLDSLEKFRKKTGSLDPAQLQQALHQLQQHVNDLEGAYAACNAHVAALQKEQQDLKNENEQIQKDQERAFQDILDACRADGYTAGGSSGHNKSTGEFNYNYSLFLQGAGGNIEFVRDIPASSLKKIVELEKKIKDGNQRIAAINNQQSQLPGEAEKAKKECDEMAARLAKTKEALGKGTNNITVYNYFMADLDERCSQVKKLLDPLVSWCKLNPGYCMGFIASLQQMLDDCPANLPALSNLMNSLGQIIQNKKAMEDAIRKQAENFEKLVKDIDQQNQVIASAISKDQQKAESYGAALDKNNQDQEEAAKKAVPKKSM